MWAYSGPTNPDRVSPEELAKDEVWSQLDRVLQLRDKESLEGKPRPPRREDVQSGMLPSSYSVTFFLLLSFVLSSSCPFCRDSSVTNPGRIFRGGRRAWLGKLP